MEVEVEVEQEVTVRGERVVRVVLVEVAGVDIFMSMITATLQTMGGFHGPRTSLEAWRWTQTGDLWMEMAGIKSRAPIGWSPGQACMWNFLAQCITDNGSSLGLSSFLREKLVHRLKKEAERI